MSPSFRRAARRSRSSANEALVIIDAHTHLGDILREGGGALIERTGVMKRRIFDPVSISESMLHRDIGLNRAIERLLERWVVNAEQARNATATLENMTRSMDEDGIDYSAVMPIPPYVYFDDLARAHRRERRLIPFTGLDYTAEDPSGRLERDVAAGARGLKLHPIIQRAALTDRRTLEGVERFASFGLPVLFHCGYTSYFHSAEAHRQDTSLGAIAHARKLAGSFPSVRFVAGHSGLFEVRETIELLAPLPNVYAEISFQPPAVIRRLVKAFGPDRVIYGSDWPWGSRRTALASVRAACRGDALLERAILGGNASALFGIPAA